ncbi:MAG: hypothetical protein HKP30_09675 [Myxococcales bacterium]|nr:hypothetical protein [Myxococcales bacterium]
MRQPTLALLSLLAVTLSLVPDASATPVTVLFEGTITSITDDFGDFPGAQNGDSFSGWYRYDDASGSPSTIGGTTRTYSLDLDYELSVGTVSFAPPSALEGRIDRYDGAYTTAGGFGSAQTIDEDEYRVVVSEGGISSRTLTLSLVQAPAQGLIQGIALTDPLPDPSLANDTNRFSFLSQSGVIGGGFIPTFGSSQFQGTVTSLTLVPEPGVAVLLACAAFALRGTRRR